MSVEPNKWGIIYNPKAGTRKVKKRWEEIKTYMDSKGVDYDYVQSEGFGSVERLSKILANNGYRTIVIVGGDGAVNDAINGIMLSDAEDKENIALGIIPNGIGNDFAKYWDLTTDYKSAVDCIINHRLKKIDVGYCSYFNGNEHVRRYFLNAVNIGLGARIVKITDQTKRFWGVKFLSYVAALFSLIFERKLYRMHLRINDEHIRGRIMTVCVGSAWGWGQTPSAVPYNGWLDVSVIYHPEFLQILSGLWMLIQGRILNHKTVKSYRTKKVKVLRAQNASVDLDGRLLPKHFPLEIGILPEKITLIIPNYNFNSDDRVEKQSSRQLLSVSRTVCNRRRRHGSAHRRTSGENHRNPPHTLCVQGVVPQGQPFAPGFLYRHRRREGAEDSAEGARHLRGAHRY